MIPTHRRYVNMRSEFWIVYDEMSFHILTYSVCRRNFSHLQKLNHSERKQSEKNKKKYQFGFVYWFIYSKQFTREQCVTV